ncbi:hypothetical protein NDU88_006382 [Pleurodeles waltl]|uniref:Uncharacterized protein n=1 Tax=Pleurodeles waltl TaxID=8319 RepID=A0AAV7WY34_PLEWA|nr:hypothetical protein NDU88_006382 [Pleurodeles waltl]
MESNSVVQALLVLQEAGREDLIKEGVLEQAWVGLKRPKRSSAERVSAAVLACTSPDTSPRKFRKFKTKSVAGRKVSVSPERLDLVEQIPAHLPVGSNVHGGGVRLLRRSGSSLRQRVAAAGRGSSAEFAVRSGRHEVACGVRARAPTDMCADESAVSYGGQKGVCGACALVLKHTRAHKIALQQAPLSLESGGERSDAALEESTLGGEANMAAPSKEIVLSSMGASGENFDVRQGHGENFMDQDIIVLDSGEEGETVEVLGGGERY